MQSGDAGRMMDRRTFIGLAALGSVIAPLRTSAQSSAPLVGFLTARSREDSAAHAAAFRRGLADSGHVEGERVSIEYRWANGRYEDLPALARELVGRRVSVLVAVGGSASALAAKAATASIPIVFLTGDNPVKIGLVGSYNRPGGNVTGVSFLTSALGAKRVALLCELVPKATVVALLQNPNDPDAAGRRQGVERAVRELGRRPVVLSARTPREIEASFASLSGQRIDALVVDNSAFFDSERTRLLALAARHAVAAIYHIREYPDAGGLMSYGASLADAYRQVGEYAGRILGGASPGDLPVIQPTKFELVINLATARSLGLAVPQSLLVQADDVLQ